MIISNLIKLASGFFIVRTPALIGKLPVIHLHRLNLKGAEAEANLAPLQFKWGLGLLQQIGQLGPQGLAGQGQGGG